jgi:hypothetical protein
MHRKQKNSHQLNSRRQEPPLLSKAIYAQRLSISESYLNCLIARGVVPIENGGGGKVLIPMLEADARILKICETSSMDIM